MIALLRTEFIKATWRLRTLMMLLGLVVLPVVIAFAVHAHSPNGERRGGGGGLFTLARSSGLLVPAAVLAVFSGFLLVLVAGFIAGDSVAGDASSGNLRYLLLRPVSRTRLVIAKMAVSMVLIWISVVLVVLAALAAGVALFGWHGIDVASGASGALTAFHLSPGQLLLRDALAALYVALGFTALVGVGTFVSTLTDTPAGAVSAAVGIYIVSEVLDAITDLGSIRNALPTHYLDAWQTMFTQNTFSADMRTGILVQVAWLVVFGGAALWWFARKDIRS